MVSETMLFVPMAKERENKRSKQTVPIRINVQCIDDVPLKQGEATYFQLRTSFYDAGYKSYFGKTWKGPVVQTHSEKKIRIRIFNDLNLYFHTTCATDEIILVIELSYNIGTYVENSSLALGWSIVRFFKHDGSLRNPTPTSVPLYYGTPRALYLMEEPFENNPLLQMIPGCMITYSVHVHTNLFKIITENSFLPENVILGSSDSLCGVMQQNVGAQHSTDNFKRPKLQETDTCILNQLQVFLEPDASTFELNLRHAIMKEYLNLTTDCLDDIKISERRLRIGAHNGLCYISEPHICQLIPEASDYESSSQMTLSNLSRRLSASQRNAACLVHRNKIKFSNLPKDEKLAIVFYVEYIVSLPEIKEDKKHASTAVFKNFYLGWSQWNPFKEENKKLTGRKMLEINRKAGHNPNNVLIYQSENERTLRFLFSIGTKTDPDRRPSKTEVRTHFPATDEPDSSRGSPLHKPTQSLPLITPTAKPATSRPAERHSGAAPAQRTKNKELTLPPKHTFEHSDTKPPVKNTQPTNFATSTPIPKPRKNIPPKIPSFSAMMENFNFPEFKDRNGTNPQLIDPNQHSEFVNELEENDRLEANEIILNFLAVTISPSDFDGDFPPSVIISFQFYHFPPFVSQKLSCLKLEDEIVPNQNCLFLLQRQNESEKNDQPLLGLQVHFYFNSPFAHPANKGEFFNYLSEKFLHIDVLHGETLMPIGCCSVNLQPLARQGRSAIRIDSMIDIKQQENDVQEDIIEQKDERTVGQLLLQLLNIGYVDDLLQNVQRGQECYSNSSTELITEETKVIQPKPMLEIHGPLANVISECLNINPQNGEMSNEKKRKKYRMEALRHFQKHKEFPPKKEIPYSNFEEKLQQLHIIQLYQEKFKRNFIITKLNRELDTQPCHVLATLGSKMLFDFPLHNQTNEEILIPVTLPEPLEFVLDNDELEYLKQSLKLRTEFSSFSVIENNGQSKILIMPQQELRLPIKFVNYTIDWNSANVKLRMKEKQCTKFKLDQIKPPIKHLKQEFMDNENHLISVMSVKIETWKPIPDETMHFYPIENTIFAHILQLPAIANSELYKVKCTDSEVKYMLHTVSNKDIIQLTFQFESGENGNNREFFLMVYVDPYLSRPFYVWRATAETIAEIDIKCVQNKPETFQVFPINKFKEANVQLQSSHPQELKPDQTEPFTLRLNNKRPINCTLTSILTGQRIMFLRAIDVNLDRAISTWRINVTGQQGSSVAIRTFEVQLPRNNDEIVQKKIYYQNRHSEKRTIYLSTDHPNILQLQEDLLHLNANEKVALGLLFLPIEESLESTKVLIFIENKDNEIEAVLSIQIKLF